MRHIEHSKVRITKGFWHEKQIMAKDVTADAVYERFKETHRFSALECKWKEGDPHCPHIYWDSDVAKWVEGVSYLLAYEKNGRFEEIIESVIDNFIKNQDEEGYFNSHFLVTEKDKRFQDRNNHELYCLGHWIEAAVAYYNATGRRRFLDAVAKYADYVERVFRYKKGSASFVTPGHPELELALVKLYETTGEKRYLELAEFFIYEHGRHPEERNFIGDYNQDMMPLTERTEIDGHSVRALYLLSAMIDVAERNGDKALTDACRRLMDNCINKRMYVTGGVGSTKVGEAFTLDYHLPNREAYAETCAAISLVFAAERMMKLDENAKYADIIERVLYNGALSGIGTDGRSFFYVNPLEIDLDFNGVFKFTEHKKQYPITQRVGVFFCSCCPPNILRLLASVSRYAVAENDSTVFINQFMNIESEGVSIDTLYPNENTVRITYKRRDKALAVRIPEWCKSYTLDAEHEVRNGYAYIKEDKDEITLTLDMPVRFIAPNRRTHDNSGRIAIMRGPVVYCAEGVDNGADIQSVIIDTKATAKVTMGEFLLPSVTLEGEIPKATDNLYTELSAVEYERTEIKLIPYYAFANRGESDMAVWLLHK